MTLPQGDQFCISRLPQSLLMTVELVFQRHGYQQLNGMPRYESGSDHHVWAPYSTIQPHPQDAPANSPLSI